MTESISSETVLFLRNKKGVVIILLVVFLLIGIAVRLIDFTDLPLDFATTRQLHSLIMTRGLYYQMETPSSLEISQDLWNFGISAGNREPVIEPPILEYLVAFTYRLISNENILVARVYSVLFWVMGGIPLFFLVKRLTSVNGAFAALAFYELIPFGVYASRSFQPEPMMIMWVLWALYFQVAWAQQDTWKNAILAGVFTGIALLVKIPMAFFVGIPYAGLVLQKGIKFWLKNKRVYVMAILAILPALIYNLLSATVGGNAGSIFGARFFPQLFTQIRWYLDWLFMIQNVVGLFPLVIGLLAFFLIQQKEGRVLYGCLWIGYVLYGYMFAYHIYTHNYYQLPLIVILALGFGFLFSVFFAKMERLNKNWLPRILMALFLVFAMALTVQRTRGVLVASSYRHEAAYWTELGEKIGMNKSVVAITQDYGYRINYWGHVSPSLWPTSSEVAIKELQGASDPEFQQLFKELTLNKSTFLVTMLNEFDQQPELRDYLLANYPYQQGDGYYIFDLTNPVSSQN